MGFQDSSWNINFCMSSLVIDFSDIVKKKQTSSGENPSHSTAVGEGKYTVSMYFCKLRKHLRTRVNNVRTAIMWRLASGVLSFTLYVSRTSLRRGVARNVANRDAIPPQPPAPLLPLLALALPRSSNEPEPEMLAYDERRRGDR